MKTSDPLKAIPLPILTTTSIAREANNDDCSLADVRQAMAHDWGVHVDAYLVRGARGGDRYAATAYFVWGGRMCDVPPCEQSFETPAGSSKRLFGGMTVATLGTSRLRAPLAEQYRQQSISWVIAAGGQLEYAQARYEGQRLISGCRGMKKC